MQSGKPWFLQTKIGRGSLVHSGQIVWRSTPPSSGGMKGSEDRGEGHPEPRGCRNGPGLCAGPPGLTGKGCRGPCSLSTSGIAGGLCQDMAPRLNEKAAKWPSDPAKCPLCPFKLGLSASLVAPRSRNVLLVLTYRITLRDFCPDSGNLCRPSGRVSANRTPWPM